MEINLELPSGLPDRFDTTSHTNVINGRDGIYAGENDVNTPRASDHVLENCGLCPIVDGIGSGDAVDRNSVGVEVVNKNCITNEPQKGLEFETKEAAYSFYREYARSVGFGITIKASRRSKKSGKFIDVKIACSRFGSKRESSATVNSRSCPKTNCKASMHVKRKLDGKWFIYSFVKEHNHEICPDDFYYAIKGRNKQSSSVIYQKKGLQFALDEGDVQMLLENFMHMQAESPSFWYAIDLDQEKRVRNVFWVDGKGRYDYGNFCDVVFFDTFYVRNKYKIPFVPVVGVNHHFQFMLLGCALIGEETTQAFVWLMRTWLRAVGGQIPGVVITDEGKSLEEATEVVFPEARHCLCLWHLLRKIPEILSNTTNRFENFMMKFNKCIYRSWTTKDFEKRWLKMVNKFELSENEWIQSLYDHRKKWVPTYMKDTFLAGLCTIERSESVSSFFDEYILRETTIKEFIHEYRVFLHDRHEEEERAEIETRQEQPILRSLSPFEKQMSTVYTHAIFKKFQVEVLGMVACDLRKECEDGTTMIYQVDDFEERQSFIVAWNKASADIHCLCRSFEYKGFLCRHAMIVLQMSGISSIPSHYILKRWTKEAKIGQTMSGLSDRIHVRLHRFNNLCKVAFKLVEKGSLSDETFDIAFYALEAALKRCEGINNSVRSLLEPNVLSAQSFLKIKEGNQRSNMAKACKKKKVQKKRKVQSENEVLSIGIQDCSRQMDEVNDGENSTCYSYVPQQDMQGMEDGSRTPNVNEYYSTQQSVQVVGQFNSLASLRDGLFNNNQQGLRGLGPLNSISTCVGHYGPQQSLQGLLQGQLTFRLPTMHGCFDIQESLNYMENSVNMTSKH